MRCLIAVDAFKGALDQVAVSEALGQGLTHGFGRGLHVDLCPLADGGEGSGRLLLERGGTSYPVEVLDAYGRLHQAEWVFYDGIGLVESAQGSPYVQAQQRPKVSALTATSRGTGQLLNEALRNPKVREVWLALGGTGNVDAGIGLLEELGWRFFDERARRLPGSPKSWDSIRRIDQVKVDKPVTALVDVDVPLLGDDGMLKRFGPQKGLTDEEIQSWEIPLTNYANEVDLDSAHLKGAGAAGGLGYAAAVLGAPLHSGAQWFAQWAGLLERVQASDVVITGEGHLDDQSLRGKVLSQVLEMASKTKTPVIAVAGQIPDDLQPFYDRGLWAAWAIGSGPMALDAALRRTYDSLYQTGQTLGRLLGGSLFFKARTP